MTCNQNNVCNVVIIPVLTECVQAWSGIGYNIDLICLRLHRPFVLALISLFLFDFTRPQLDMSSFTNDDLSESEENDEPSKSARVCTPKSASRTPQTPTRPYLGQCEDEMEIWP